jgi:hypothetical protein
MQYLLMIFNHERDWDNASQAQKDEITRRHAALEKDLRESGKYKFCGGLANASTASCVRLLDGEPTSKAGPFVATREHVGGYYVVDVKGIDEAIGIAKRIPMLFEGMAVEIRAIAGTPD